MNNYAVEELIAHRPPMVLISRMKSYEDTKAVCEVDITETSPFFEPNIDGVANYIGIEYMAQSIAAFAGAKALDKGERVDIGFLLGSRKYQTFQPKFNCRTTYQISVEELYKEDSGLTVFACEISNGEQLVAKAKVNAFQPENPEAFLKEQQVNE